MGMSGSRQESAYTSISRCRSGLANTPPWQTDHYPQVVRWTQASGTTGGKGEVPSQGSRPISSLFSCRQLPFCYGAGQQDSSEYLGKGGVAAPSSKWYRSFGGAAGVVRSTSDNRWLEPTTPSCPRRGLRLSLQLFSMPPCPAKDVGHGKPWQRRGRRAINKYPRSFVRRGRGGSFKLQNNSLERTTRLRPKGGFATFS